MIYLVTNQSELYTSNLYTIISAQEALNKMQSWKWYQFDTETNGRDAHICDLLCAQFGYDGTDERIVVDCSTVDIKLFKNFMESRYMIGQNLKFDLQFLYKYEIIPRRVYDTMIVEQLLYLGYPAGQISFSLKEIAWRYLHVNIDKSVRGEIRWRGLDEEVIKYAAGDVTYLEKIMHKQSLSMQAKKCMVGGKLECDAVPAMAYLEWCGVKLDIDKWKAKMSKDEANLIQRKADLDSFIVNKSTQNPKFSKFVFVDTQGDLFAEQAFDLTPKCLVNWDSATQVVEIVKLLGFDPRIQDKKTGEDKNTVLEKHLSSQKGIDDKFLTLYFAYKESSKVCSTYGWTHINAVNPLTGRIHTTFKQLGAATGRMSCGSSQKNEDLARLKKISPSLCTYPNLQQLPHDEETRACFVSEKENMFCSCDFSAK